MQTKHSIPIYIVFSYNRRFSDFISFVSANKSTREKYLQTFFKELVYEYCWNDEIWNDTQYIMSFRFLDKQRQNCMKRKSVKFRNQDWKNIKNSRYILVLSSSFCWWKIFISVKAINWVLEKEGFYLRLRQVFCLKKYLSIKSFFSFIIK